MAEEKTREFEPEEIKDILNFIGEKLPSLLDGLTNAIYGKEASTKFGAAVSNFYRTLKDSGMSDEQAFKLTEQYMSSLNLGGTIAKAFSNRGKGEE